MSSEMVQDYYDQAVDLGYQAGIKAAVLAVTDLAKENEMIKAGDIFLALAELQKP